MSGHGFERTTCACAECVACCKRQPGPLAPGDMVRIMAFLQWRENYEALFWASPGAVVGDRATGRVWRVGTITPQVVNDRCVFLDAQDRCRIHPVAPFGCSHFDPHMDGREVLARAQWLYDTIARHDGYQALRWLLPSATSWRPI